MHRAEVAGFLSLGGELGSIISVRITAVCRSLGVLGKGVRDTIDGA